MNYVPYHMHSMLSSATTNIDSITNFRDYVKQAKMYGMKAMAISEHGNILEWLHKKEAIESAGMKYIHAVEAYLTWTVDEKIRDNYHCVLIAKNYDGVKELNLLVSQSYNRDDGHFYYVPRITFEELFNTSDNIIVTTACLGGVLNSGGVDCFSIQKEQFIGFLRENADRCFLEIQHHNCKDQIKYNQFLYELSKNIGVRLIAGTDTHALNAEHMDGRAMLQRAKGVHFENEDEWDPTFKSYVQLVDAFRLQNSLPMDIVLGAIETTNEMADMVEEFSVDRSPKYPKLYRDSESVFKQKINDGVKWRGIQKLPNYKDYVDRIHYEYDVYKHNGAIDFMLLEENYKSEMRKRGVKYGYSRGSVSGSIIAYLLGITEIDSVKYNLNFERFMNKERVSLADVDTDWLSEDRETVKSYLFNKDGLYCCDIVTLNTIALKGAIRDIGRALEIPLDTVSDICDRVEDDEEYYRKKYPELFKYVDMVNGCVVSVGNHPAGCVVSPFPVDEWFGTFTTSSDKYPISLLNMKEIDSLNFVKLDILGLDNCGLIYKTCDAAGIPYATPDNIPPDDIDVWNSIRDDTTMIFQWESGSATAYLKRLFSDNTIEKIREKNPNFSYMDLLSIGNGAIRPAGESYRDKLAQGIYQDNGHDALNEFLAPTLGYLVYQEQIIEFLHSFCGYTMGEADVVRRGFAKKTGTEQFIPKIKSGFKKTMMEKYGVDEEKSDELIVNFIKVIEDASSYLFSKNHADPYSWIGYICGYLRYYYPLEFITTALNIFEGKQDKSVAIIEYAKKRGIEIRPIKFRHSIAKYSYDKEQGVIFKGISSIKYMNETVANELYALRNNTYDSFTELLFDIDKKTSLDERQKRILIDLDFFEEFGDPHKLEDVSKMYEIFGNKTSVRKENLDSMHISYDFVKGFAEEKPKSFTKLNSFAMLKRYEQAIKYRKTTVGEKISHQIEHLGYVDFIDKRYAGLIAVLDINTKYTPRITCHALKTGKTIEFKIPRKYYNMHKLNTGEILKVQRTTKKEKSKLIDGEWKRIQGEYDDWILEYEEVRI